MKRKGAGAQGSSIPPLADVAIVKSSQPPSTLTAGDRLTYTLVYTNNGPDEAVNGANSFASRFAVVL